VYSVSYINVVILSFQEEEAIPACGPSGVQS